MFLLVGLGNPGPSYAKHRHNVGFMAVDALAEIHRASAFSKKFHGEVARASIGGQDIWLLKPHTFMNDSGRSVQAAMAFHKIPPEQVIVLHDELDLPVGKVRIKKAGGANGQNGVRDIDAAIGKDYWRVRIGINHPGDKEKVHGHVLSNFGREDKETTDTLLATLAEHFGLFFTHSPAGLMSKVSDIMNPPPAKKPAPRVAAE